jgi:4-alpha-glucanotransferase
MKEMMQQYGIRHSYEAASGEIVEATQGVVRAVVAALGEPYSAAARMLEPVVIAWGGHTGEFTLRIPASSTRHAIRYEVRLENGDVLHGTLPASQRRVRTEYRQGRARMQEIAARIMTSLPEGYHELTVRTDKKEATALLISAPRRCYSGDRPREWGVFAPVYAIRQTNDKAIGDFSDLESLMQWVGEMDGDLVATLPISAAFLSEPFDPSPYSPASRLFWNELYLRVEGEREGDGEDGRLIDYREAARAKRARLEPIAQEFFRNDGRRSSRFTDFITLYPDAEDYAQFRAAGERYKAGWPAWPEHARDGRLTEADFERSAADYHLFAQMVAHEQLSELAERSRAAGVRLYLDMPLGVHPDSYDVWRNRELFITGVSAGAPPDPFFTRGQNWGFPPINPIEMRERHYQYWRKVLQTQLRYAGILRLDHVMSLHRLYLVPNGFEATDGVYIGYPAEEMYAILALESSRHQAVIVGEDLGTVPAEVRKTMDVHGVKRMFVLQFEATGDADEPVGIPPKNAVASLNTHDMPPFSAYWQALDADLRSELGLLDEEGVSDAREQRNQVTTALSRMLGAKDRLDDAEARTALLDFLARSDADMLLVNLEDLWLEREPQNTPGTSYERPNWRRRLKYTLDEMRANTSVSELLDMVDAARRKTEKVS